MSNSSSFGDGKSILHLSLGTDVLRSRQRGAAPEFQACFQRSALVMHKQFQSVTFMPSRSIKPNGDSHFFFSFSLPFSEVAVKMGFFRGRTSPDKVMEGAFSVN